MAVFVTLLLSCRDGAVAWCREILHQFGHTWLWLCRRLEPVATPEEEEECCEHEQLAAEP
jgi:hypothetical protein